MSKLRNKIKVMKSFQQDVQKVVIQEAQQFESEIIDMNALEQLRMRGEDAKGNKLRPYTAATIAIKQAKGQVTSHVTLKDEGDFHDSFFVNFGPRYLAIGASDQKTAKLERKYGKAIFGLTDQNLQDLIDMVKDPLVEAFRKAVV